MENSEVLTNFAGMEKILKKIAAEHRCNTIEKFVAKDGCVYYSFSRVIDGENVPIGKPLIVKEGSNKLLNPKEAIKILSLIDD